MEKTDDKKLTWIITEYVTYTKRIEKRAIDTIIVIGTEKQIRDYALKRIHSYIDAIKNPGNINVMLEAYTQGEKDIRVDEDTGTLTASVRFHVLDQESGNYTKEHIKITMEPICCIEKKDLSAELPLTRDQLNKIFNQIDEKIN